MKKYKKFNIDMKYLAISLFALGVHDAPLVVVGSVVDSTVVDTMLGSSVVGSGSSVVVFGPGVDRG